MCAQLPSVVRYISSKYVAAFFDTGALRLSPYSAFKGADVPASKRDAGEGWNYNAADRDGNRVVAITAVPSNILVLCASTVDSVEQAMRLSSDQKSGIRIRDPEGFAREIQSSLPGCLGVEHRPCDYSGRVTSEFPDSHAKLMQEIGTASEADKKALMLRLFDEQQQASVRQYFRKEAIHREDAEYRFVWFMDRKIAELEVHLFPDVRGVCVPFP